MMCIGPWIGNKGVQRKVCIGHDLDTQRVDEEISSRQDNLIIISYPTATETSRKSTTTYAVCRSAGPS